LKEMLSWSLRKDHPLNGEDFATHSPIRSTQVFILRRRRSGNQPIVTGIPSGAKMDPAGSPRRRVCWVAFPDGVSETDEGEHLSWLRDRLGSTGNIEFRLADVGELDAWEREDLRLRSAHLPLL
jgi:hypothetical protein